MNEKLIALFKLEKATKNTYRYAEVSQPGKPPAIGTLYVQKWALGEPAPSQIQVEITIK